MHDGAPNGERVVDGQTFSVFDELLLWRGSELPTSTVSITAASVEDVHALVALFEERGFGAEPWSSHEMICACCSEGQVSQDPRHAVTGKQRMSLAAPVDEVPVLLETWRAGAPGSRGWAALPAD